MSLSSRRSRSLCSGASSQPPKLHGRQATSHASASEMSASSCLLLLLTLRLMGSFRRPQRFVA
jgi:hypothetical protein